ncbi:MAG: 4-hydroxythreonine-4-phosphate dehydrogenase PdxA [Proteobacteria bacterium]|nr:4-hydroxythreonine-4-phosphate dehydrogenase PdxA [Cystobacterineae bacterium]MCL2259460.1 4-hydroxythreonine-4-phosphate dehydrogenase PdxA [Cystobacterineae bacterium]MCL2314079.1 4-hydroxythreonine-4-phosphate dehydrogenase PdxA [Pseudomonadota bacterium]
MSNLPRIGISAGDPSGIAAEVLSKALLQAELEPLFTPVVFGDASLAPLLPPGVELHAVSHLPPEDRKPAHPSLAGGRAQLAYVNAAIAAAKNKSLDALCTAPVSKEAILRTGIEFFGHTEWLAEAFECPVLMLMDGPKLRVALATNHLPLAQVSQALSVDGLVAQLQLLSSTLSAVLGRPARIAMLALNPHAGEGGLRGEEELHILRPALEKASGLGLLCKGPFPADGFFASLPEQPFDAVLAMYHDQGLCVAKAIDFENTVNVTLGLPLPRTSPDHGVAYDIAGQNKANPRPMLEALLRAAHYAKAFASSTPGR